MLDGFISIPGPSFLMYYALFSLFCLLAGWMWVGDDSLRRKLPELTYFDNYALAALQGSYQVIHTVLFSLWSQKRLVVETEGDDPVLKNSGPLNNPVSPVESYIFNHFKTSRKLSDVLKNSDFKDKVDYKLEPVLFELRRNGLLRSDEDIRRSKTATKAVCISIGIVGGVKLIIGITRHKPSLFLILAIAAFIAVAYFAFKPNSLQTRLGRKYIAKLKEHFKWARDAMSQGVTVEGFDPPLLVAIFGAGFLAEVHGYTWFSPVSGKYKKNDDWWYWGGCGGGCGHSCGGGCGSSCGGGCGGCGGCGST